MWIFEIFLIFSLFSERFGFNCTENATLCQVCKKFGETDGVNTYFSNGQCSIYAGVKDEPSEFSIPERCELLFSKVYPTSCQMAVISNVDLLGYYIQYGIRATEHSMLLSLYRDNCTATWDWWSRLENKTITAGTGDATEDCDIVQGAFSGFTLVRINPFNFTPSGVLCQCGEKVSFLPTVTAKSDISPKYGVLLVISIAILHFRVFEHIF